MTTASQLRRIKPARLISHTARHLAFRLVASALLRRSSPLALGLLGLACVLAFFTDMTYDRIHGIAQAIPEDLVVGPKQFVNEFTIFTIVCLIWIMDRRRRIAIPSLLIALFLSGSVNAGLKMVTGRARPTYSKQMDPEGEKAHWLLDLKASRPDLPIRMDGGDYWLWLTPGKPLLHDADAFQSFPSGHSCTAFALACFLCMHYPQARWLWLLTASGCAVSRVAQNQHFPEDVLFGGALGWLVAAWLFAQVWPYELGRSLLKQNHRFLTGESSRRFARKAAAGS